MTESCTLTIRSQDFLKKKKGSRREDERRKKEKEITDRWWSVIVTRCWRRKKRIFRRWFVRRGEHFSKGGWYRAQKHPKILASVGRRAMHYSRGCAHVPRSPCLRMYYIRRACARWRHCARRAAPEDTGHASLHARCGRTPDTGQLQAHALHARVFAYLV